MARRFEVLLTLAASAIILAFFASVPHWPSTWTTRDAASVFGVSAPLLRGPSVLSNLQPVPSLNLAFPDDVASVVRRSGINGETGLIPTAAAITTFRLDATGDIVAVSSIPGADAIVPASPDSGLRVHGRYAVAVVDRGVTHIRWTENGVTYDIGSRTVVDVARLTEVANTLR